jgi:hypothetical protein
MKNFLIRFLEPLHRALFRWMCRSGYIMTCVDAPDTDGVNDAAKANAQVAADALDWFKGEAARTQGQRDTSTQIQQDVARGQLSSMQQQQALAQDYADYNKGTYRPLEQRIVADSQSYDTPGRQEAAASQATADVRAASNRAVGSTARTLMRMGFDPSTNATKMAQQNALAEAGAATNARRNVEATGRAMRMDAASLGRGLPSAQATAIQTGTSAGGAAAGAAGAAANTQMGNAALMGQGFGTALQGYGTSGNLYARGAELNAGSAATNAGLMNGLGQMGGMMFAKYMNSSKRVKTRMSYGGPKSDHEALDAIVDVKNRRWKYDAGVEDGGEHIGPYAEEAQAAMGDRVAPGGKGINLQEAHQFNAAGIRAALARIEKLETALAGHD